MMQESGTSSTVSSSGGYLFTKDVVWQELNDDL